MINIIFQDYRIDKHLEYDKIVKKLLLVYEIENMNVKHYN